jgi:2-keto-4-pentenoate hydratase/2-oxohepta-3-ene-1,7-dioic acid hydratase in catechol pathway
MRIVRFQHGESIHIGDVHGDEIVDLTAAGLPFSEVIDLIAGGPAALELAKSLSARNAPTLRLADVKLPAPLNRPGKYLAIGMNYASHVEEAARRGPAKAAAMVQQADGQHLRAI